MSQEDAVKVDQRLVTITITVDGSDGVKESQTIQLDTTHADLAEELSWAAGKLVFKACGEDALPWMLGDTAQPIALAFASYVAHDVFDADLTELQYNDRLRCYQHIADWSGLALEHILQLPNNTKGICQCQQPKNKPKLAFG